MKKCTVIMLVFALVVSAPLLAQKGGTEVPGSPQNSETYTEVKQYFKSVWNFDLTNVYWGDLHAHSSASRDASFMNALAPKDALNYARTVEKMDFATLTDHSESSTMEWGELLAAKRSMNQENEFIVFPGYEYTNTYSLKPIMGSILGYGHKHVLFKDINLNPSETPRCGSKFVSSRREAKDYVHTSTAPQLWNSLEKQGHEGNVLTIAHCIGQTGGQSEGQSEDAEGPLGDLETKDHRTDMSFVNDRFLRHIEIYSKWGNSEGPPHPEAEFNNSSTADFPPGHDAELFADSLCIRHVLYEKWVKDGNPGYILGFVGGTDTHLGKPGSNCEESLPNGSKIMKYEGTITGIVASELSRSSIWEGLWNRHTLANLTVPEGEKRTPVLFAVEAGQNKYFMGESGSHNGNVTVYVLAGERTNKIEVLVNGVIAETIDDRSAKVQLNLSSDNQRRHFIYIRLWETDQLLTYSSPVYLSIN